MKINYKKGLVAFSAFLFTTMNTAYAAPQNMQLKTESVLNANGQKIIINSTLWYGGNNIVKYKLIQMEPYIYKEQILIYVIC